MISKIKHKAVMTYLNRYYDNLQPFQTERWVDSIFFMKDGNFIFEYNKKNGYVYISYPKIWSFLESFFGLEYGEIQDLAKEWVEEQFKMGVTITTPENESEIRRVEEQFKMGVTTTNWRNTIVSYRVEVQFKMGVTTTGPKSVPNGNQVEEQFKMGVTTTT